MPQFAQDILRRRLPQFLALYLGVSWGVVEFFAFLEDRFLLSPHWTNLILLTAMLLLPSVALFIYFHGAKGPDRLNRVERIVIPGNLGLALVLLFGAFSGKDLSLVTTTVAVEDEDGNEVEHVVVKDEFLKTLALFTLASDKTDPQAAWLGMGVSSGLQNELIQDRFISIRRDHLLGERIREAGYASDAAMPRSLKRALALEMHVPFFVDGEVERAAEGFRLTLALHDTERGRVVSEREHKGSDLFALIDSASLQLRRDLELPSRHLEDNPDVPVAEHTTGSMDAFRHNALGQEALIVHDDYAGAEAALQAALTADSGFADAALTLYQVRMMSGNVAGATAALRTAMDNLHRLPERAHFMVKGEWYAMRQDLPKSMAVYDMWAELHPSDILAQSFAAQIRWIQGDRRGAIEAYEKILSLDPTRIDLLPQIGQLYEQVGEPEQARRRYEQHVDAAPEDTNAMLTLGRFHQRRGDHGEARALFERAELLDPNDVSIAVNLARSDESLGDFAAALTRYRRTLGRASTAEQRSTVLMAMRTHYVARGQMVDALEVEKQALTELASFRAPIVSLQRQLLGLDLYVYAGREAEAEELLTSVGSQLKPPQDVIIPVAKMVLYGALDEPDGLAAAIDESNAMMERTGMSILQDRVIHFTGRLAEIRGDWEAAVAAYLQEREDDPLDPLIPARLGRCYREMGDLDRAESLLRETLEFVPSHGRSHYELALVYERMGRRSDAVSHLNQALETWASADEGFRWARLAREKLAEF